MNEERAAAYYEEQKAKGAGAAQLKRGLGYQPPNREAPPRAQLPAAGAPPWVGQSYPPHTHATPFLTPQPMASYPMYYPPSGVMNQSLQGSQSGIQLASSGRTSGSTWTAHRSGDLVYYYNSATGMSQWERPLDFLGPVVAPAETPKPVASERVPNTTWTEVKCEDGRIYYYNLLNKETVWNVPEEVTAARDPESVATVTAVRLVVDQPKNDDSSAAKRGRKATDEEKDAFASLLHDSGVTAYARFEKEASKLQDDPRWLNVSLEKERRTLFDAFCRERAQEQSRSQKEDSIHDKRAAFEALLSEANPHECLTESNDGGAKESNKIKSAPPFSDEAALERLETKYKDDPRWKACPPHIRKEVCNAFYKEVSSGSLMISKVDTKQEEEMKQEGGLPLSMHSKRSRSRSISPEQGRSSVSETKRHDPREGSAEENQKRARVEREMRESEERLKRASHESAVSDFRTLLSELVRQPNVSWNAVGDRILSDIQGRGNHLSMNDREREDLFYEHVDRLNRNAVQDYQRHLVDKLGMHYSATEEGTAQRAAWESFEAAEKILDINPRSLQPSNDAKKKLWRSHVGSSKGKDGRRHEDEGGRP